MVRPLTSTRHAEVNACRPPIAFRLFQPATPAPLRARMVAQSDEPGTRSNGPEVDDDPGVALAVAPALLEPVLLPGEAAVQIEQVLGRDGRGTVLRGPV